MDLVSLVIEEKKLDIELKRRKLQRLVQKDEGCVLQYVDRLAGLVEQLNRHGLCVHEISQSERDSAVISAPKCGVWIRLADNQSTELTLDFETGKLSLMEEGSSWPTSMQNVCVFAAYVAEYVERVNK